ncbi:MAG: glycerophosphodiester phosphodiesterase family protein [Pseudomonadota bacterium]
MPLTVRLCLLALAVVACAAPPAATQEFDPRPRSLAQSVDDPALRTQLLTCDATHPKPTRFVIGHRGAPLEYAEHTVESYTAAARQGAGLIECDVTFTADGELVCRHAPCDLASTTNILQTPLADRCEVPFRRAEINALNQIASPAFAKCCTSALTLAEFRTLTGRQERVNPRAFTVDQYLAPPAVTGTLLSHADSIALIDELGADFAPELKAPDPELVYDDTGLTDTRYADLLIEAYVEAGVPPERVRAQSFRRRDLEHWLARFPAYGSRAVWLDGRYETDDFDPENPASWNPSMSELAAIGIQTIAPPLWVLLGQDDERIVPSAYARAATVQGFDLITWTIERSGSLSEGGGWYYQTVTPVIDNDGDVYVALRALRDDVGVSAVFSDWPATITYFEQCVPRPEPPTETEHEQD